MPLVVHPIYPRMFLQQSQHCARYPLKTYPKSSRPTTDFLQQGTYLSGNANIKRFYILVLTFLLFAQPGFSETNELCELPEVQNMLRIARENISDHYVISYSLRTAESDDVSRLKATIEDFTEGFKDRIKRPFNAIVSISQDGLGYVPSNIYSYPNPFCGDNICELRIEDVVQRREDTAKTYRRVHLENRDPMDIIEIGQRDHPTDSWVVVRLRRNYAGQAVVVDALKLRLPKNGIERLLQVLQRTASPHRIVISQVYNT